MQIYRKLQILTIILHRIYKVIHRISRKVYQKISLVIV